MENQQALREEKIGSLLLKYSIPAIIAMMVTSMYNVVDRAFIGSIEGVGAMAIAGLGVTMPVFTLILAFGMLVAVGGGTNLSIKLGENNKEEGEKILGNTFVLSIVISIIITVVGLVFLDDILYMFGASEVTITYARDYISVILMGTIFNLIAFSLNSAIRAEGNPKLSGKIMVVGCVLNLILDPIFIFIFKLGIKGAAIATVLCQAILALWTIYYFTKGKSNLKLKKVNFKLDINVVKPIILIGLTPFIVEIMMSVIHVLSNNALKVYGGDLAIGSMTVLTSISQMFMMPIFGLNQGMQTIISYNYGAKQYDRTKKTLLLAIISSVVLLSTGFIIVKMFPEMFINIFNKDKELVEMAIRGININLLTLPVMGVCIMVPVYFQSIGKVKQSMFLTLLRQVFLLAPLILILPRWFGLDGVWMAQPIGDVVALIFIGIFLIKEFKRKV